MTEVLNKIVIPGHGPILMEAGLVAWNLETGEMLTNTGHNQSLSDADSVALCDFLRPKP